MVCICEQAQLPRIFGVELCSHPIVLGTIEIAKHPKQSSVIIHTPFGYFLTEFVESMGQIWPTQSGKPVCLPQLQSLPLLFQSSKGSALSSR